jgi:hypothetical protein
MLKRSFIKLKKNICFATRSCKTYRSIFHYSKSLESTKKKERNVNVVSLKNKNKDFEDYL